MKHKFQWQEDLYRIQRRYVRQSLDDYEKVLDEFKKSYPGNYRLRWNYDADRGSLILRPVFDRPEEETFWKLKYSN